MAQPASILTEPQPPGAGELWRSSWRKAWDLFELESWYESVHVRGNPLASVPEKMRIRVYDLITERQKLSA